VPPRLAYGAGDLDIAGCIDEAAERTISHLDYAPIATGRYTCVFSPEAFLDLIGAFSSLFNARAVLDGVSLSSRESLGQQLAAPCLNLHDNGLHPGNIGAASFDGEGTPTRRLTLLEGGVLRQFLHSEATARAFGVAPTGHAGHGSQGLGRSRLLRSGTGRHHRRVWAEPRAWTRPGIRDRSC
jgi:PmbA protein